MPIGSAWPATRKAASPRSGSVAPRSAPMVPSLSSGVGEITAWCQSISAVTCPVDPTPALHVRDPRVKAAFAMAPGIIKAFGMDEAGLSRMPIPAYLTVGARDTQTPPGPNPAFAAPHIPPAQLAIIPRPVNHEIFVKRCNDERRDQ